MSKIICKNCNSVGHTYRDCPHPISSYGIICFTIIDNEIHYLMIQRKIVYLLWSLLKVIINLWIFQK